ncbi:MAG: BlaR1 family beta-lactam sensor/signal transducer [Lachnospiraceae bacterium]|nr:BlaR1 family beta-lactam sensor/signal transducer [Lachnospiraceae bacterium]
MGNFVIQFLISNVFIAAMILLLLAFKKLFQKRFTSRMQYRLWFLLLGLLAVPFLSLSFSANFFPPLFSWLKHLKGTPGLSLNTFTGEKDLFSPADVPHWMEDFGIAVSRQTPSPLSLFLFLFWIGGILGMILLTIKSAIRFNSLKKSCLPVQNPALISLYHNCQREMNITKNIPILSTAFLKSPMIAGIFKPCIYLPLSLILDHSPKDIRYMLLHELSHYRHKDSLVNCLMHAACILYWFNPFVWYARKAMRSDREMACDASVLDMLEADAYEDYGHALINYAEKISHSPFFFSTGIGGNMAQMQKRILNIANYQKASSRSILFGLFIYVLIAFCFSGFLPFLSIQAAGYNHYSFSEQGKTISYLDLADSFGKYEGSFVLYDTAENTWQIYNQKAALTRVSPVSTYKIYSALLGLEAGIISPEQSLIPWNGHHYVFSLWNADQTLESAMEHSVTWYFQAMDQQAGFSAVRDYVHEIGYGSQTIGKDLATYWTDASLTISPVEQVEMLKKFYYNQFDFSPENINAVKESIHLSSTDWGDIYGKTGTGEEQGQNTLGWFIGYIETSDNIYFFASNIQNETSATGSAAADLTFSILSDLNIWK